MPLDLTTVKQQINNVKRNLFLEEGLTLKFINVSTVLLQLEDGWYLDKSPERDNASPEFYLLSVADTELNLDKIIPKTTSIKVGEVEYGSFQYTRPRESTKEWLIKLQSLNMKRDV